jgi:hypothetical protein
MDQVDLKRIQIAVSTQNDPNSFLNISDNFKYFIKKLFCSEKKYKGAIMGVGRGRPWGVGKGAAIGRRGRGRPQGVRRAGGGRGGIPWRFQVSEDSLMTGIHGAPSPPSCCFL